MNDIKQEHVSKVSAVQCQVLFELVRVWRSQQRDCRLSAADLKEYTGGRMTDVVLLTRDVSWV